MPAAEAVMRSKSGDQFHGGAIASLVDVAGDMAIAMEKGGAVPTIDVRVDYLRPSIGTFLVARAHIHRLGRIVGVVDIDGHDDMDGPTAADASVHRQGSELDELYINGRQQAT